MTITVDKKEIEGIRTIRNESAKGKTRLVFELKKDAPALVILNQLYRGTPLQTSFSINMVALDDGVPRICGVPLQESRYSLQPMAGRR